MKKYEAVFILEIRKVEDEGKAFSEEFAKLVQSVGGEMHESVPMGRRQFAREIKGRKAGIYWDYVFSAEPDKITVLKDKYRLDERVVRMMFTKWDKPATPIQPLKEVEAEI